MASQQVVKKTIRIERSEFHIKEVRDRAMYRGGKPVEDCWFGDYLESYVFICLFAQQIFIKYLTHKLGQSVLFM